MAAIEKLEDFVHVFRRDVELARRLESANPQDDLAIKTAIVGFSYNSSTENWAKDHFRYVQNSIDRDYNNQELVEYGGNSENVKLFFALCIGYLLGLYQEDLINHNEFRVAEMQIPGIIMLHLKNLTNQ